MAEENTLQKPHQRQRFTKKELAERDAAIRAQPFRTFGGEELNAARLRVKKMIATRIALAAKYGRLRGSGVETTVRRKACNAKRDK